MQLESIDAESLYNALQARKIWPSGGPPVLFDVRPADAYATRHLRAAHGVSLADGELLGAPPPESYADKPVCVYAEEEASALGEHPIVLALQTQSNASRILLLTEPFSAFDARFPFLSARADSRSASKRPPSYPSCIIRDLLYLGDLEDAAALPRLRETLNIRHCITALADPPESLKASVAESRATHTWCNVRDVAQADIKEHFERAYDAIEKARTSGTAVLVHCSRGVSRSARQNRTLPYTHFGHTSHSIVPPYLSGSVCFPDSTSSLVIAYLMRKRGLTADEARALVVTQRPIVLPNEGKSLTPFFSRHFFPARCHTPHMPHPIFVLEITPTLFVNFQGSGDAYRSMPRNSPGR
tara:strand:+ start:216 stop:1283 length:1068 start_codon:yes stop_codon:yes gene_type:complete